MTNSSLHPAIVMFARKNNNLSVSSSASSSLTSSSSLSPTLGAHRSLLFPSPPPSPALPSLLPRHGKKSGTSRLRRIRRLLVILAGLAVVAWTVMIFLFPSQQTHKSSYSGADYETVGASSLPEEPSVVIVTGKLGKSKWTVSIPPTYDFPLRPSQCSEICSQSVEISHHLAQPGRPLSKRHRAYYYQDPSFLDVRDAEEQQLLPASIPDGWSDESLNNPLTGNSVENARMVCERSLTYVLETSDAGLGKSLAGLWLSYGLAQKEGRAFFVDDTRWPYGRYASYFTPPPVPTCLPPPKSQILPCPHSARHLVVSAATSAWTFGPAFLEEYEDPRKPEEYRQRRIFALMREGYEALFHLADEGDANYVEERVETLYGMVHKQGGINIGMHVRRGDRHPWEYQYSRDYLPLSRYVDAAHDILNEHFAKPNANNTSLSSSRFQFHHGPWQADTPPSTASSLTLASDDPDIYTHPEMSPAVRAQDRIMLASKHTLLEAASASASASRADSKRHKYIDDTSGWEGGFYRNVFWSLGRSSPRRNPTPAEVATWKEDAPEAAMRLRELVGRAYLLDLAVLGRADAVACALSAAGCRILAVMMGWDRATEGGGWRNVDGGGGWRWD